MLRTMSTFEHGVTADHVEIIREENVMAFNRAIESKLNAGYKLIQPIETHTVADHGGRRGDVYHVAVVAYTK